VRIRMIASYHGTVNDDELARRMLAPILESGVR
jgi:hypothetical protein